MLPWPCLQIQIKLSRYFHSYSIISSGQWSLPTVHLTTVLGFQAEWEALELTDHQWALENVEEDLMSRELDFDGMFSKELPSGIF